MMVDNITKFQCRSMGVSRLKTELQGEMQLKQLVRELQGEMQLKQLVRELQGEMQLKQLVRMHTLLCDTERQYKLEIHAKLTCGMQISM